MIDSHCHLDADAFIHDCEQVLERSKSRGVSTLHVPGTTADKWTELVKLSQHPMIDISLGLHPYFLTDTTCAERDLVQLDVALKQHAHQVVAVGECGLDGMISIPMTLQHRVFQAQITLAQQHQKPLIVHARKTHHLIMQDLKSTQYHGRGIIHAFSGPVDVAKPYLDRDWLLGIGGTITYPRGRKTQETIKCVGLEHLVLETDAPDMPLRGYQGQRNTPERLGQVAQAVAQLLDVSVARVIQQTTQNYQQLVSST
ncbi:TatD family hydrolase [Alteromonas sp. SM 2104]|nr:TatD family hydrolase [Alteromonas oceanisediminis]